MLTIMDMLGVPTADQPAVANAAEKLFGMSDDEYSHARGAGRRTPINEIMLLSSTGVELAQVPAQANPGDDLMTSIVNAEVDGHRLTDEEIGAFLILLASAGNDTTKQATTHAMMALADNPAQRDWLMEDFDEPDRPGRRGIRPVVLAGAAVRAVRHRGHRDQRAAGQRGRQGRACSTARPTATKRSSTTRARSTCRARPTRTSASAAAARTSASATSWPRPSCETCSASC